MKLNTVISLRLPDSWVTHLKSFAIVESYHSNHQTTYTDLIRSAIQDKYFRKGDNDNAIHDTTH